MSDNNLNMIPMMQPRRVITRTFNNQSTEYTIRLTRPITEIDDFEEEIMALEEATENDVVFMQLSSPGGSLETCDFICRRMDDCAAPIVVEVGMTTASAASAICLHADDWRILDSSTMMVHACSYSPGYGKEVDVRASVENTARINKEWVERTYRGFLTDEELQKVLDGKDLYFYADDLRERLPAYREFRNALREESCTCGECGVDNEEPIDIMSLIEDKVAQGVEKSLDNLLKKYDITPKPKKAAKSKESKVSEAVVENVKEFNKGDF